LGFGANATGGRSGSVYHVTTLADSGPGSFRDAVGHANRIIVFDVGGYINLLTAVSASSSLTIAGQTAPGGGIGIMGAEVSFYGQNNIICRHLRFRQGDIHNGSNPNNSGESAINLGATSSTNPASVMIFDHISVGFGSWDSIDAVNTATFTVQHAIIADPINQQFGAHHEGSNASWVRNIWANAHNRQPLAKANTIYVNNVVYNYQAGYTCGNTGGFFSHDIVNNYFITGPSTTSAANDFYQIDANQSTYGLGNLRDSDDDGTLGGSPTEPNEGGPVLTSPWSPVTMTIPTFSTAGGYRYDVSRSGAAPRDQVDAQVIGQVTSLGTAGQLFNSQGNTGLGNSGYGVINGGVPALDSDGDGMPDFWEKAVGLNPNSNDAMNLAGDGYANLEHYLNWLADPHALTSTNTPINLDLWQYTAGYTNASPVYAAASLSNCIVTLSSGHIAQFTPATNFSGLAAFQFSVVAADGNGYTDTVTVVVSALPQPSDLVWQGDGVANLWAVDTGTNWLNGTNLVAFASGDNVTFDDTGSDTPAINLSGSLSAGAIYVVAAQDYTFGGSGFLAGPSVLFKTGSGQLTLDTTNTFSGGTTINDGILQIGDGVSFNGGLSGNVTNNDTLIYANPAALTSPVSITGPGTLTKNGPGGLTLSGTQTYTGLTTINAGSLTLSGTLPPSDITNNALVTLSPSGSQIYSNLLSGPGNVSVSGSGTLTLNRANTFTGNLTNVSGLLLLAANQAAGLGTVVYAGGSVMVGNGVVVTNNFSIPTSTSDLSMMASNGATGVWAGNIVNLGSGASWRPGSDGATLIFTGTALQGSRNFIVPRGTFQIASNAVVSATGTATAFGRDTSANNRSANITLKDNAVVTLGLCSMGGNQAGGNVTLTLQNNAVLAMGASPFDVQNVNRSTAVTTLRLNGGAITVGGFNKSKTTYTNLINFNRGVLRSGSNNVSFLPAFNLQTANVQAGGAIIDDGGFAITIAQSLNHDPALGTTPDGGLTKLGTGVLTLSSSNAYTGPTTISAGTLALFAFGLVPNTTNIYVGAGAAFDVTGTVANGNFGLGNGGQLLGNGLVTGILTLTNGGILAPGSNAIGTLTFSNTISLAPALWLKAGCTSLFELSHSPLTNDVARILGRVTLGGALVVSNIGSASLAPGDSFKLIDATNFSGAFSSVQMPPLPIGLAWNTNNLNTAGMLSVVLNTAPVFNSIVRSGNSLILSGSGGVGNGSYLLLGTTNLTTPVSNWTRLLTNQFDVNGNFSLTNSPDPAVPQTFYALQLH
jgi:autotransporter-associated beta strand protein